MLLEGRHAKQIESKELTDGETNIIKQNKNLVSSVMCRNCGRNYPHTGACPAKGKIKTSQKIKNVYPHFVLLILFVNLVSFQIY